MKNMDKKTKIIATIAALLIVAALAIFLIPKPQAGTGAGGTAESTFESSAETAGEETGADPAPADPAESTVESTGESTEGPGA